MRRNAGPKSAVLLKKLAAGLKEPFANNSLESERELSVVDGPISWLEVGRPERDIRKNQLKQINVTKGALADVATQVSAKVVDARQKADLQQRANGLRQDVLELDTDLSNNFLPQHSGKQLISPQIFLMSKLFNVRSKGTPREELVVFDLVRSADYFASYRGPELRQPDGLIFMALINMARDLRIGTSLAFEPSQLCNQILGYYDGDARNRLKESIYRLQHAVLRFPTFSVQLAMRFEYPKRGAWSVMLDPQIVGLFKESRLVWMDFGIRKSLPEGLTTWLYSYVEAQTKLIPQKLETLRALCGSDATEDRAFAIVLRRALNSLTAAGVIEDGWSVKEGILRWKKHEDMRQIEELAPVAELPSH